MPAGGRNVRLVAPDGATVSVPRSMVPQALADGWRRVHDQPAPRAVDLDDVARRCDRELDRLFAALTSGVAHAARLGRYFCTARELAGRDALGVVPGLPAELAQQLAELAARLDVPPSSERRPTHAQRSAAVVLDDPAFAALWPRLLDVAAGWLDRELARRQETAT